LPARRAAGYLQTAAAIAASPNTAKASWPEKAQ